MYIFLSSKEYEHEAMAKQQERYADMFYITHYINYYIHSINDSHEVSAHKHTQKHMTTNI